MAKIKPFPGVYPTAEHALAVAALPYDVMSTEEARVLAKDNPRSFLRIEKSEIEVPADVDQYDDSVYQAGRKNLRDFIREGWLVSDDKPNFYFYRQVMDGRVQTGLVAGASVEDYENDIIKKHEHTRADKENDRTRHVDTIGANTGSVFLTYPAREDMNAITVECTSGNPLFDFTSDDGIRHTFWVVSDQRVIDRIVAIFGQIPALYVADGHHRSAAATRVCQARRANNPAHTGDEEYNFFLSVIFPHNELYIMDYNRVVKDLFGHSKEQFLTKIADKFVVTPLQKGQPCKPDRMKTFGMYLDGLWYHLEARPDSYPANDPVNSLDVAILQNNLLEPILGIADPRRDKRIDFVGGIRGLDELRKRVDAGEAVAFSMYPTTIEQLMAIADAGQVMPPKSTWFEPKLRSGVIVHLID